MSDGTADCAIYPLALAGNIRITAIAINISSRSEFWNCDSCVRDILST